jgi:hypothetical protein
MKPGKTTCWVMVFLLGCAVAASAQTDGENGDIRTGYVVVTPQFEGGGQNLIVSATYGQESSGGCGTTQAGVLSAKLGTSGILPISANIGLNRDLGIAIVNPGEVPATVTLTLYDANGTNVGSTSVAVNPMSQVSRFVSQIFAGNTSVSTALQSFTGLVTYQSDAPVAVMGLRFQGNNFSTVPATITSQTLDLPSLGNGIGGPGSIIVPQFAVGQGWNSQIVVTNTNLAQPQQFRVDIFGSNGSPLSSSINGQTTSSFQNQTVSGGGSLFLSTNQTTDGNTSF